MMRSLYTAASGMTSQQFNVEVISNNLANVNTTGFKKVRAEFEDLLYETLLLAGTPVGSASEIPTGIQVGHGSKVSSTVTIHTSEGNLQSTGEPLNIAIEGQGFFQITLPDGSTTYTRDGSFKLDSNGQVVTNQGYLLTDQEVVIPQDALQVSVSADGIVNVLLPGNPTPQQVAQLNLANFINPSGLEKIGENLYRETAASGAPVISRPTENNMGSLRQGFLELSNVQVVEELVNLIVAQRAYESNSKSIQTSDEMLNTAVNLKR